METTCTGSLLNKKNSIIGVFVFPMYYRFFEQAATIVTACFPENERP